MKRIFFTLTSLNRTVALLFGWIQRAKCFARNRVWVLLVLSYIRNFSSYICIHSVIRYLENLRHASYLMVKQEKIGL